MPDCLFAEVIVIAMLLLQLIFGLFFQLHQLSSFDIICQLIVLF